MQNEPPYPLQSVDNALRLAQLLQTEGSLRLTDAAARLNVAPSTAHRLLAMLVYRDSRTNEATAPTHQAGHCDRLHPPMPLCRCYASSASCPCKPWSTACGNPST